MMRRVGVAVFVLGIALLLLPAYSNYVPVIGLPSDSGRWFGALLVVLGAVCFGLAESEG